MSKKLKYREVIRQPYKNCYFSAGFVDGHPVDTMYYKLKRRKKPGKKGATIVLMRPDEMAALAWCLIGALWSEEMRRLHNGTPRS